MTAMYEQLEAGHFRLLKLLPGQGIQQLQCSLSSYSVDACPKYEALSYEWALLPGREDVICHGHTCSITSNAAAALRRLRLDSDRNLWMDQLCINQADLDERQKQVQLMYEIFSRAARVVIWLGPDPDGLGPVIKQFMDEIGKIWENPFTNEPYELARLLEDHGLPPVDSIKWQAYRSLMGLSYWRRIWMVQEVRVTKNEAVCYWGETGLFFIVVAVTATWGLENSVHLNGHKLREPGDKGIDLINTRDCSSVNQLLYSVERSLPWLIRQTPFRDASDDRDKIYGLLNLVPEQQRFPPDYTLPRAHVFQETAAHIIFKCDKHLDILTQVALLPSHPSLHGETWPTWAPVWSKEPYVKFFESTRDQQSFFDASLGEEMQASRPKSNILSAKGLRFGIIDCLVGEGDRPNGNDWNTARDFDEAWRLTKCCAQPSTVQPVFLSFLCNMLCGEAEIVQHELPETWVQQLYIDFMTWAVARSIILTPNIFHTEVMDAALVSFLEKLDSTYDCTNPDHKAVAAQCHVDMRREFPETWQKAHAGVARQFARRHPDVKLDFGLQERFTTYFMFYYPECGQADVRRFSNAYCEYGVGMRFFVTDTGDMGMSPRWAKTGDLVVLLFGLRVPLLLRPIAGVYQVVGSCYVHGAMHGERVQSLKGTSSLDATVEVFDLC